MGGRGGEDFSFCILAKKLLSSILYLHLSSFSNDSFDFKLEFDAEDDDDDDDNDNDLILLVSDSVLRDKRFLVLICKCV